MGRPLRPLGLVFIKKTIKIIVNDNGKKITKETPTPDRSPAWPKLFFLSHNLAAKILFRPQKNYFIYLSSSLILFQNSRKYTTHKTALYKKYFQS